MSKLIATEENHVFTLDEEALESVLLHEKVKDKPVVIISVAGDYRKGKSFLLNFFLRYLQSETKEGWMGSAVEPLTGFNWQGGSQRVTTGIQLWSEPYVVKIPSGEEVAVLLMDTQGVFDCSSTVNDCATVFALSTLVSLVTVYNLMTNIQENDLQNLQLFAGFGQTVIEEEIESKPYQKLTFLVRDWPYPYEYDYGQIGGDAFLENKLEMPPNQHAQLRQVRTHLRSCFDQINCYLMPNPGEEVNKQNFNGCLSNIKEDFKIHVKSFVESMLKSENLVVKKISGRSIKGSELLIYFREYIKQFQSGRTIALNSIFQANADGDNLRAILIAEDFYTQEMEKVCGVDKPRLTDEKLTEKHQEIMAETIKKFNEIPKMGDDELSEPYRENLIGKLTDHYKRYETYNSCKQFPSLITRYGAKAAKLVRNAAANIATNETVRKVGLGVIGAASVAGVVGTVIMIAQIEVVSVAFTAISLFVSKIRF